MRTRRAIAFLLDGGLLPLAVMQSFSIALYLSSPFDALDAELADYRDDYLRAIAGTGHGITALGVAFLFMELTNGLRVFEASGSLGFALCGLRVERDASSRPTFVRRLARTAIPIVALLVSSVCFTSPEDYEAVPASLEAARQVLGGAFIVSALLVAIDVVIVVRAADGRTLGDQLARVRVLLCTHDAASLGLAARCASALALIVAIAAVIDRAGPLVGDQSSTSVLAQLTAFIGYMWMLAKAAFFITLTHATTRPAEAPRSPLAVAILATLPVVSFFFVRAHVQRISAACALPYTERMTIETLFDIAYGASSAAALGVLANLAAVYLEVGSSVAYGELPTLVDPTLVATLGLVGIVVTGIAFHRFARLPLEEVVVAKAPLAHDASVFS